MLGRILWLSLAAVFAATAQKYDGSRPPKPDVPYLKHADTLIPTEAVMAKEEKKKDDTTYVIDGANSTAKTPLASPIFLMQAIRIVVTKLSSDGLWKIEVDESLEPGEYSLSPEGFAQVFCFQVF